jgi:hypothetical protein
MAAKTMVILEDDLDGGPAAGALRFGLGSRGRPVSERGRIPAGIIGPYEAASAKP